MDTKMTKKTWITIIFFGLIGQIAWQVENMQFNVYVYNTVTQDSMVIALMVAFSAVTATLTTIFIGGWCDKVGKKKLFISIGYIIWGLSTILFGVANITNFEVLFKISSPVALVSIFVVLLDCVMTLFGSTANDVAFNAWITENVPNKKRGVVEGTLSLLSPLAGLLVVGLALILLDTKQVDSSKWEFYYLIIGGLISICGIIGLFIIPKDKDLIVEKSDNSILKNVIYGFKISTIKENKLLYISLIGAILEGIAFQTFYPYLIIYIQQVLNFENYIVPMVVIVLSTCVFCFVFGYLADKIKILKLLVPAISLSIIGLIGLVFVHDLVLLCILGSLSIGGLMAISTLFIAIHRDKIPKTKEGQFQGIRIISVVLIPMVTGPFIGSFIAKSGKTYEEFGQVKDIPSNLMFLAAAIITIFIIIPSILVSKELNKEKNLTKNEETTLL
jgi:MFS family permease